MHIQSTNLVRLSLELLNHRDAEVRRQVYTLLVSAYGPGVMTALHRLITDQDVQVRRGAERALETLFPRTVAESRPLRAAMHITCLGSLRVFAGSRWLEARDWSPDDGGRAGWQKVQAAFSYLYHCGIHGTTRSALGEAVWGAAASTASLARTLTTLKHALNRAGGEGFAEQALSITGDYCRLDPQLFDSDVQIFERLFTLATETEQTEGLQAAAPLYRQALELYGGPYMSDIAPGNGWMLARRDLLSSLYVLAAERLAADAYERRDDRNCVLICVRALEAEPAADDLLTWMLRAYARLGRYLELEQAYRNYLRVTGISQVDQYSSQDAVVKAYLDLTRQRAVNE